jgi:hypothetical protein
MADRSPNSDIMPEPPRALGHLWHVAKSSSSRALRYYCYALLVLLSAQFAFGYWKLYPNSYEYEIDKAVIILGFFLFLFGTIFREISRIRKERYANIFERMEAIFNLIKDLTTYMNERIESEQIDLEQIKRDVDRSLISILDNIEEIFSMLTGTTCRTTVKCIFQDGEKLYVYALARDRRSGQINRNRDEKRRDEKSDPLEDNEDFYSIFSDSKRYCIENDLIPKINYKNTSFKIYGNPRALNAFQRLCVPTLGWTLPYRSTMVFPIRQDESNALRFAAAGCLGFLAIDSAFKGVFQARFDGPLGASFAEALFHPLSQYFRLLEG